MAASPLFKIYRAGKYVAACKHAEDAAMLMQGTGDEIRAGHAPSATVWREGAELQPAGQSYDFVAAIIAERLAQRRRPKIDSASERRADQAAKQESGQEYGPQADKGASHG